MFVKISRAREDWVPTDMLRIDVALQIGPCNMYVAIKKSSTVAQKVDSCRHYSQPQPQRSSLQRMFD